MKANAYEGALDQDKMTRASLPMGVLQGYRSAVQWTADLCWPKTANTVPSFNGKTPVRIMSESGTPEMMKTPKRIDALGGGL